jgi:ABC-type sugar transport system ATPase subunit
VSFSVRAGEIVGLAGLIGAGRTEIARAILGADPLDSGAIYVEEQPMPAPTPAEAIRHRLAYTPEDRKTQGLLLARSVEENVNIANLPDGLLPLQHLRDIASHWVEGLKIRTRDIDQQVKALSGGNQQKVLFGRWLARGCKVLILDEPTRGVDIGARAEMYKVIFDLAQQGVGILLISSDLPELMGLSDTILVIREGCVSGRFDRNNATPEAIMTCAVPT